jgi:hypothetical protein
MTLHFVTDRAAVEGGNPLMVGHGGRGAQEEGR